MSKDLSAVDWTAETDRVMRGGTIAAATLLAATAATPLFDSLGTQHASLLALAALVVIGYGVYLVMSSALAYVTLHRVLAAVGVGVDE